MNIQLTGSVDIRKTAGDELQLFGTVQSLAERSYFEQFGRRFSLTQGSVTFNGDPLDFRVDAEAQYEVPSFRDPSASEVVITMDVGGTLDSLDLTLGSQPTMENADIISYLATGRPAESAVGLRRRHRAGRRRSRGRRTTGPRTGHRPHRERRGGGGGARRRRDPAERVGGRHAGGRPLREPPALRGLPTTPVAEREQHRRRPERWPARRRCSSSTRGTGGSW